ncbi:hypothetical protein GS454_04725 [Rhodococcus hoagii]|nr:hypothetical protein [Prescottella equi]
MHTTTPDDWDPDPNDPLLTDWSTAPHEPNAARRLQRAGRRGPELLELLGETRPETVMALITMALGFETAAMAAGRDLHLAVVVKKDLHPSLINLYYDNPEGE